MWFRPDNRHSDDVRWRRDAAREIERLWHVAAIVSVALLLLPCALAHSVACAASRNDNSHLTARSTSLRSALAGPSPIATVDVASICFHLPTLLVWVRCPSLQPRCNLCHPSRQIETGEAVNRVDPIHSVVLLSPVEASLLFAHSLDTNSCLFHLSRLSDCFGSSGSHLGAPSNQRKYLLHANYRFSAAVICKQSPHLIRTNVQPA
jgi:hypothetical protein